jgi:hypothetical protein
MKFNLDLFAMVPGYVCADMTLAFGDWREEDGSDVELWEVNDDEDKWTAYIFIRNLYFICAIHTERLSR